MSKITYVDKVTSNPQPGIPTINKVTADDMTEIKTVVNDNDTSTASHIADVANPHSVTKAQVGLTSADDTSDANKPVSTATQTALDGKLDSVVAGSNVTIDNTDPNNPIINSSAVGGGGIVEDGTKLKYGSTSDYGVGTDRVAGGQGVVVTGDNSLGLGLNTVSPKDSLVIGINIGQTKSSEAATIIGKDILEYEIGSTVIQSFSNQTVGGLRSKSWLGTMIGNYIDINSSNPSNSTVNQMIAIGSFLTCKGNTGARGILIGTRLDAGGSYEITLIGKDNTVVGNMQRSVCIGDSQTLDSNNNEEINNVVIGYQAKSYKHPNYGVGVSEGHKVVIGFNALGGGWRNTVLGSHAYSDQVSNTVVGYGAQATLTGHTTVFGRGGYNSAVNGTGGGFLLYAPENPEDMWFGSVFSSHLNTAMPGTELHDSIASQNAGTLIKQLKVVSGVDATAAPVNDTRGGHMALCGGESTGTALGGEVIVRTSPVGGASNNIANPLIDVVKFDAAAGVDTRFMLLDVTDGTLKRVQFGADDSAGAGFKTLKVAN